MYEYFIGLCLDGEKCSSKTFVSAYKTTPCHDSEDYNMNSHLRIGSGKSLLALASTVILGSESHGTHDHTFLSDGSGSLQTLSQGDTGVGSGKLLPVFASTVILGSESRRTLGVVQLLTRGRWVTIASLKTSQLICGLVFLAVHSVKVTGDDVTVYVTN
jgi:hypothetical protein